MKIIATLKSRNEEKNIRNAIESYDWADRILLADGGSKDKTIEIAREYPKVSVRNFTEKYYREDGSWRNYEGRHLNFLFD
jgi:glycosyltransferase involved in cell wall biosynthesis